MARETLKISKEQSLPVNAATQKLAWLGTTGSGKTYGASKLAEQFWYAGAQFVVLDPVGVWYGLRLDKTGKKPSTIDIPVFGGLHGDMPLDPGAGKLLANLVVDKNLSAIIDVSQFESDAAKARFAADFADQFFHRKKANASAVHLFIEECQEFVPQNPQRGEERMLHAFVRMQKLGRNFGIGSSYISQRPQEVNKKALNMAQTLFVFRNTGTHERKAIELWIKDNSLDENIANDLPKIPTGQCHIWSPEFLKISEMVHILEKDTFNASATPEVGKKAKAQSLASIDIKALQESMADTIAAAANEDPALLRKKIQALEGELKKKVAPVAPVGPMGVSQWMEYGHKYKYAEFFEKQIAARFEETIGKMRFALTNASSTLRKIAELTSRPDVLELTQKDFKLPKDFKPGQIIQIPKSAQLTKKDVDLIERPQITKSEPIARDVSIGGQMGKGETSILTAAAQLTGGATRPQLTVLTGYKKTTRNRYIQTLQALRYVELEGDRIKASPEGVAALGPTYEPLPTGPELQDHLMRTLPKGEMEILKVLLAHAPNSVEREILTEATGYQKTTRNRYLQSLAARELVEYEGTAVYCSRTLL